MTDENNHTLTGKNDISKYIEILYSRLCTSAEAHPDAQTVTVCNVGSEEIIDKT